MLWQHSVLMGVMLLVQLALYVPMEPTWEIRDVTLPLKVVLLEGIKLLYVPMELTWEVRDVIFVQTVPIPQVAVVCNRTALTGN